MIAYVLALVEAGTRTVVEYVPPLRTEVVIAGIPLTLWAPGNASDMRVSFAPRLMPVGATPEIVTFAPALAHE